MLLRSRSINCDPPQELLLEELLTIGQGGLDLPALGEGSWPRPCQLQEGHGGVGAGPVKSLEKKKGLKNLGGAAEEPGVVGPGEQGLKRRPLRGAGPVGHPQLCLTWCPAEQENQLEVAGDLGDAADAPAPKAVLLQGQQRGCAVLLAPELHPVVEELGSRRTSAGPAWLLCCAHPLLAPWTHRAAAEHQQQVQEEDDLPLQANVLPTGVLRGDGTLGAMELPCPKGLLLLGQG